MTITIYGSIGSRASRCLWTAEEIGLAYDWQPISTLDGSNKTPAYLAINPSGKIPALSDGEVVMTESMAIVLYLAQHHGSAPAAGATTAVWPAVPAQQAMALQWLMWSVSEIEYYIGALFPQLVLKAPAERDQPLVNRLLAELLPKLGELERALDGRDYLLDTFSLADIGVAVQTFTMVDRFKLDLTALPRVLAWTERCRARPARRKVDQLAAAAAAASAASAASAAAMAASAAR